MHFLKLCPFRSYFSLDEITCDDNNFLSYLLCFMVDSFFQDSVKRGSILLRLLHGQNCTEMQL